MKRDVLHRGFTLIELIVVIGVILLVSFITILNSNAYTDTQKLRQAGLTMRSDLRLVHTKAQSGLKPLACDSASSLVGYTVDFFADTTNCAGRTACYRMYPVCNPDPGAAALASVTQFVTLPEGITFSNFVSSVTFSSVTGRTDLDTNATFTLLGQRGNSYVVIISPSGVVSDYLGT